MKLDPRVKEFKDFLTIHPKKSGEPYSEVYIKNLCYYVQQLIEFGFKTDRNHIEQIATVNKFIDKKNNEKIVCYPMVGGFKTYLRFLEIPGDKIKELHPAPKKVKNPWKMNTLSEEEIDKLLDTEDQTLKLVMELFFYGPFKKYQILKIKFEDIDFDKGEIFVEDKGGKRIKKFIEGRLKQDLKNYIESKKLKKGLIFSGLTPYTIWYRIKKLGKQILKKPVSPITMTHSRINILRNKHVPFDDLKVLTGRSGKTLMDYPPLPEENAKKIIKKYSD